MPFTIHKTKVPDRVMVMGGKKNPAPQPKDEELPPAKKRGRPPKNRENKDNA